MSRTALVALQAPSPGASSRVEDEQAVYDYAATHGLSVEWAHGEANTMSVAGDADALAGLERLPGVLAVLGLDDRPVARTHIRRPRSSAARALTALQVAQAYNFPGRGDVTAGRGQFIKLVELGGGYPAADVTAYFKGLGLPAPKLIPIGVSGGSNQPGSDADGEVELDVFVAGAIVPGATILIYFGPNTDAGFLATFNAAFHDTTYPGGVVSCSWGGPESSWSKSAMTAFDQAFATAAAAGIPVLCAAGDAGSTDGTGKNVADFPASSPHAIACGGTRLLLNADGSYGSESVWNDDPTQSAGGGGYSGFFARPSYQASAVPGSWRGVPDVTGNADPDTGYEIFVDGQKQVVGGTSAVAPLYAALFALLKAQGHTPTLTDLYGPQVPAGTFHDVTSGSNGGYKAGPGWDATSGLGSIDGSKLLAALQGAGAPSPTPVPTPTPAPTPPPTPSPVTADDADRALWERLGPWTELRHSGQNRLAATAAVTWAKEKGLT